MKPPTSPRREAKHLSTVKEKTALGSSSNHLNTAQAAFCNRPANQPLRLLAPAGCGKTHSLLWRCQTLAAKMAPGEKILAVTFTRAARDELRFRMNSFPEFQGQGFIEVTTLNSWGKRFLVVGGHVRSPSVIASDKDKFFAFQKVADIWNGDPTVAEAMGNRYVKSKIPKLLMELADEFKTLGFRHDQAHDDEAMLAHVLWLKEAKLLGYFWRQLARLEKYKLFNLDTDNGMFYRAICADSWREWSLLPAVRKIAEDNLLQSFQLLCLIQTILPLWAKSCQALRHKELMTFDDQKYWAWLGLQKLPRIKAGDCTGGRYRHILVDEFQDINPLDLALIKELCQRHQACLTLVGDDDQAIYEWRGATPEFILDPGRYLEMEFHTDTLDINYRSPQNIVAQSQQLIANNRRRVAKKVKSSSNSQAEIRVEHKTTVVDALDHVLGIAKALQPRERLAIIGRKRSQLIPYQILFASQGIPFYAAEDLQIFLSTAFDELREILVAWRWAKSPTLAFARDPADDLLKICDKVRRYPLNKSQRAELESYLRSTPLPSQQFDPKLLEALAMVGKNMGSTQVVKILQSLVPSSSMELLLNRLSAWEGQAPQGHWQGYGRDSGRSLADPIRKLFQADSVSDAIRTLNDFKGFSQDYDKGNSDVFYVDPPFLHLEEFARRYGADIDAFIRDLDLAKETLARPQSDDDATTEANVDWRRPVHLLTALRAKGKEFDTVVLLEANDGFWPAKMSLAEQNTPEEREYALEQERRIFYVATTRARRRLVFIVCEWLLAERLAPSPFLAEFLRDPESLANGNTSKPEFRS